MSKCPYTWVKSIFSSSDTVKNSTLPASGATDARVASNLRVEVQKQGQVAVDVTLPAKSARWLISVIPSEVLDKIRDEKIPIDLIQEDLAASETLYAQSLFSLQDAERKVTVWLE